MIQYYDTNLIILNPISLCKIVFNQIHGNIIFIFKILPWCEH